MDDRWMRALLRPLDLLAFLSMTPVPSDARTPHPGRVPLAASAAGPRPAITARRHVSSLKDRGRAINKDAVGKESKNHES